MGTRGGPLHGGEHQNERFGFAIKATNVRGETGQITERKFVTVLNRFPSAARSLLRKISQAPKPQTINCRIPSTAKPAARKKPTRH